MEERLRRHRLVKAILKKRFSSDNTREKGEETQKYFKKSLDEMNRFEKELKRNLE